jgi:3-oxoacyl-[acyl-carrier-protein] synthase II
MELKRVVVTGLGAITPLGNSVEEFWENLVKGVSGAGPITKFDTQNQKTKFACEVRNFDPGMYLERKEARKHDLYTQFAFGATAQAMEDSGINLEKVDKDRVGIIWGSGIGGLQTFLKRFRHTNLKDHSLTHFLYLK